MQEKITYSCTALSGTNKKGILKPDADGYYEVVLGALDMHNNSGQFYPFQSAKHAFESSGSLMRRIQNGALKGECGHPRKLPGMSNRDFIGRVLDVYEPNVSHHIKEITLVRDKVKDKNGKYCIAIMGKVKPAGPRGPALAAALENPDENVSFSIRSLTQDEITPSSWTKHIKTVVTFDWVNEPGMHVANKYSAPGLESMDLLAEDFVAAEQHGSFAVGFEDDVVVTPTRVLSDFDLINRQPKFDVPPSMNW